MSTERLPGEADRWRRVVVWSVAVFAGTLPFSHVPAQLALAVGIIGWIAWSVRTKHVHVVRDMFFLPAIVYWVWNILASALSERPNHSLMAFVDNEWPAFAGLLLVWSVRSENELRKILLPFFAASAVAMLVGVGQSLTGIEWIHGAFLQPVGGGLYRAVGFSGFSLTFAASSMCVLFLSWAYAMEHPARSRRWILPPLSLLAIMASFARGVWLTIGVLIPVAAGITGGSRSRKVAAVLWTCAALAVLFVEPLRERAFSIFDLARNENRFSLWKTSLAIFASHPLLGVGQDNFSIVFERFRVEGYYDTIAHPHNDYLSVLVHGGLPALIAFVSMWAIALRRGWTAWVSSPGSLRSWLGLGGTTALAGFLLSSIFQNYYGTFVNCFNWWFVIGIILSSYHLRSEGIQSNS